jgi:hypothetical protein
LAGAACASTSKCSGTSDAFATAAFAAITDKIVLARRTDRLIFMFSFPAEFVPRIGARFIASYADAMNSNCA